MSSTLLLATLPAKADFVGPTDYPDAAENCALFEVWSVPPDLSFYDYASDYFWCQPASLRYPIYAEPFSGMVDEPFAQRLRGYVTIPESGEYQFEESSTGESLLMIGADGTPFSKIPVDSQTPEVSPTLHRFMLQAGQKIYLEAIQLQVELGPVTLDWGWVRPDGVHEPIPANLWESFSLRSDDADDNGLPDTFENSYGIAPPSASPFATGLYGWAGDFNQNGFTNLEEYQTGNSPTAAPETTPSTPSAPPPSPSIVNGAFNYTGTLSYSDNDGYGGADFSWNYLTSDQVGGWVPVTAGNTIELWNSGGKTFCELAATRICGGIKQVINNPTPGTALLLTWQHQARSGIDPSANNYTVRIYRTDANGGSEATILEQQFTGLPTTWTQTGVAFTVPADLTSTQQIWLAFIPSSNIGAGTLLDEVKLLAVDIEPDPNMAGVIGDVVKSAKAGSTVEHFVTPKKTTELNQEYVILKAVGVTAEQITDENANQIVQWDGGLPTDPPDPLKRRVKRDATGAGPTEVKIKTKQGGVVAAQMNVWVVWVDFTSKLAGSSAIDGSTLGLHCGRLASGYKGATGIDFTGTITPQTIITDTERPALEKQQRQAPLGSNLGVPGPGNPDASGSEFSGWDTTRQKTRRTWKGPNLTPTGAGDAAMYTPVDYPTDALDGNDDASVGADEDSDPYTAGKGAIGNLIVNDEPKRGLSDALDATGVAAGSDGDRLHFKIWFREFARVQIGTKWYLVSKKETWRFYFFAKRISGQWQAEPSTQDVFDTTNAELP